MIFVFSTCKQNLSSQFFDLDIENPLGGGPHNERAHARSNLPFFDLSPTYHPTGGVQVLQKAWNLLSDDVKAI
jgi:hypothetical protein